MNTLRRNIIFAYKNKTPELIAQNLNRQNIQITIDNDRKEVFISHDTKIYDYEVDKMKLVMKVVYPTYFHNYSSN